MNPVEFGFLANATAITWQGGANKIEPLAKHAEVVAAMQREIYVHDGWCYPPLSPVKSGVNAPLIPAGFALPATHQLHLSDTTADDEEANFMIALFGLLKGQRLQRPEWQHFYKAPVASKLNDFLATDAPISKTLDIATAFWRQYTPEVRKLAFGALHWHLFAQLYEHQFERFNAQYMALDACAELALATSFPGYPAKRPTHAIRASVLCDCTGAPKPAWVDPFVPWKDCALARRRNALAHEAMYGGQPVGFAYPADHTLMELELTGLVARIFMRLLGVRNEYTDSPCTTLAMTVFGLPK
jgi:hypothetical protein